MLVLAHGHSAYVRRCLDSLLRHAGTKLEAVLVENGADPEVASVFDDFSRAAERSGHKVKRLRFEENVGAVRARNEALALVESEFVAWLDSDCLARTRAWLRRLVGVLEERTDVGIVGPKLVYPWPPHLIQCAGADVTRSGRVIFRGRGSPRDDPEFCAERLCPCIISACWVMRTRLFHELGPLDELFSPVQFEDIDYCYRARQAGWKVLYYPAVEMYHFEGVTTARSPTLQYTPITARNAVRFKRKWREVIEREGGIEDRGQRWLSDVGWRPIEELGELELID